MPTTPYYAVIFASRRSPGDNGYADAAQRMEDLARQQPGFIAVDSVRGTDGVGITVSYWESLEAIAAWKANAEHRLAQARGRREWYSEFSLRVCKVEKEAKFP